MPNIPVRSALFNYLVLVAGNYITQFVKLKADARRIAVSSEFSRTM